ncbi:MAG: diadenylate cyclase CdaA [Christensenellales bacterium]
MFQIFEEIFGYLSDIATQFQIKDIIDILIVAILIYKLLIMIKDTRGIQVIKGIAIILVASLVASLFRLQAIEWLLQYLIGAGAMVLVILFQPELRNMLEKIGRSRLLNKSKLKDEDDTISVVSHITNALLALSRRKIGALIVVEQNTRLSDYAHTGTLLDSAISDHLLENIFEPNTPLHDGAVIIRGMRIIAAGCYLPLSANQAISKALGTRHRAALGISEMSDALTFIVSEETANISVARGGKLTRNLGKSEITSILDALYEGFDKNAPLLRLRRRGK